MAGVKIYAEYKGKLYSLRKLRKCEDACKGCAISTAKCGCEKQKVVPCDDIYFAVEAIHDGNYKVKGLTDKQATRLRKLANAFAELVRKDKTNWRAE